MEFLIEIIRSFTRKRLFKSGLIECYAGVQYLKLKMLLDIFYYRELDVLLSDRQYEKPEW